MAGKEKVDIKRSDQFQEVDDELTRAMAELDSTIERVSLIFQAGDDDGELPGLTEKSAPEAEVAEPVAAQPEGAGEDAES